MRKFSSSVTITDPLVKYQSLLSTGLYSPDPAQHRLAIHLQKIYHRLKDYSPSIEYQTRLKAIRRALEQSKGEDRSKSLAVESHPIRRNPLFARFFARTEGPDTLSLTRVLTSHEEAISIDSPQGLFLSGEVGTGKSMLLDLLAEGLPTSRKRRWHFNTFMLYTLSQLEHHRKTHARMQADEQQYSLLWMAKEMIERSPILFLDEFQLPDKAASKILSNLFTAFFQLGGVLVASSNRMPEELERAAGFDYSSSTAGGGVLGQLLGLRKNRGKGELYGASSDFAAFLEVLKARCEFWQMEGGKDWRRREADELPNVYDATLPEPTTMQYSPTAVSMDGSSNNVESAQSNGMVKMPRYYHLHSTDEARWSQSLDELLPPSIKQTPWESTTLTVYGRTITIPHQHNGIVHWDFADLVSAFGPADYITMASTFHTFIIDGIPVLTVTQKNEARRLITLLDALYEARCKLVVRASAGPDDLFFPEAKRGSSGTAAASSGASSPRPTVDADVVDADALHSETIAEAYQDARSPFRPNISSYDDDPSFSSSPSLSKRNTSYDPDHEFGAGDVGRDQSGNRNGKGQGAVDFSNTAAFTGEDERFAYRRAASRLWELCGARWHARPGDAAEWWRPLPPEARHWERRSSSPSAAAASKSAATSMTSGRDPRRGEEHMGPAVQLDELAGLQKLRVEHLRRAAEGQ